MALSTYSELKASIASWLNRADADTIAAIPDFIKIAETNIERSIRHWRQEKRATATIDTQYSALPADYLEGIRFNLDSDSRLVELVSSADMQRRRHARDDTPGKPQYFSVTGGQIEVFPTPDAEYTGELYYYSTIDALSDSNTSNWVLQYYPDAYLYGSLLHSAPYLVDDARMQTWAALFSAAVNAINTESEKAKFSGSGLRMKINSY
jgi:hypothetical protein